jgi:hypothetical protein
VKFDNNYNLIEARTKLIDVLSTPFPFSKNCRFPEDYTLLREVCCSKYSRFPENDMYVCVDKAPLFVQMAKVMRVLATPYTMLREVLLFGHGRNKRFFATNKELPAKPNLSDLSLQNKHKYT